jgi:hypothetical protein
LSNTNQGHTFASRYHNDASLAQLVEQLTCNQ